MYVSTVLFVLIVHSKVQMTDVETWAVVERLYDYLQRSHRVVQNFHKRMLPLTILTTSLGVIVSTFISIRYFGQLPLVFYVIFPYVAFTLMAIIWWLSYDIVLIMRASQDVLSRLLAQDAQYCQHMSRARKLQVLKKARTRKALEFPVEDFTWGVFADAPGEYLGRDTQSSFVSFVTDLKDLFLRISWHYHCMSVVHSWHCRYSSFCMRAYGRTMDAGSLDACLMPARYYRVFLLCVHNTVTNRALPGTYH